MALSPLQTQLLRALQGGEWIEFVHPGLAGYSPAHYFLLPSRRKVHKGTMESLIARGLLRDGRVGVNWYNPNISLSEAGKAYELETN